MRSDLSAGTNSFFEDSPPSTWDFNNWTAKVWASNMRRRRADTVPTTTLVGSAALMRERGLSSLGFTPGVVIAKANLARVVTPWVLRTPTSASLSPQLFALLSKAAVDSKMDAMTPGPKSCKRKLIQIDEH